MLPTKWPLQMALFQRLAYTDAIMPPVGSMMIERHGIMLRHLGLEGYKGHLSSLVFIKKAYKWQLLCHLSWCIYSCKTMADRTLPTTS